MLLAIFIVYTHASSRGAFSFDALGICSVPTSGAYNDSGRFFCPQGMHRTLPPERTDAYTLRTGDGLVANDPDEYIPDTIIDLHLRVHSKYMKYLGILMYAVKAGSLPRHGCPEGCDGMGEEKVGGWEIVDAENFKTTIPEVLTHAHAKKRRYHHVFRFRTPPVGTGSIIIRCLLKQGATNGGSFYWPMTAGDLELHEAAAAVPELVWKLGSAGETCSTTCGQAGLACDASAPATLSAYDGFKLNETCSFPLLSACLDAAAHKNADGSCTFHSSSLCTRRALQGRPETTMPEGTPPPVPTGIVPTPVAREPTARTTPAPVVEHAPDACGQANPGGRRPICPCTTATSASSSANEDGEADAVAISVSVVLALLCCCACCAGALFAARHAAGPEHVKQLGAAVGIEGAAAGAEGRAATLPPPTAGPAHRSSASTFMEMEWEGGLTMP